MPIKVLSNPTYEYKNLKDSNESKFKRGKKISFSGSYQSGKRRPLKSIFLIDKKA
jgi:hypothetical protein